MVKNTIFAPLNFIEMDAALFEHIFTVIMLIANIVTVFLAARGSRWTWIFGVVTGVILCYNFFHDRLYLSFAFNVYSTIASIVGVFSWKKKSEDNKRTICWGNPVWPLLVVAVLTVSVYFFDANVLHSNLPFIDCLIPSLQAVATFLMVRKDINAWVMYLICNCIYIPLGLMSHQYKWLFISACFLITATYGMVSFVKAWKQSKTNN